MLNSLLFYTIPFILAFILSFALTPYIRKLALRFSILDFQDELRKRHPQGSVPLLGGLAVILSFFIIGLFAWTQGWLTDTKINDQHIIAIILAAVLFGIHGWIDDKFHLKPLQLFVIPVIVAGLSVWFGIQVEFVTNPFESGSGPFGFSLFYFTPLLGIVFSFLWILGMMYTVKFLDGLDGLVTGIGAIGAIILFVVSLFWDVPLSGTSVMALILAGALLGFLPYHWFPAKIFLGESSIFIGFMLGVLSIISGAKIAAALLIMGIPILDVAWVIIQRLFFDKQSPFKADRKHLHFRLLDLGISHRTVVVLLYLLSALFGTISIFLQTQQKIIALGAVVIIMVVLLVWVFKKYNTFSQTKPESAKSLLQNKARYTLFSVVVAVLAVVIVLNIIEKRNNRATEQYITISGKEILVDIADTLATRTRGLSGIDTLAENTGMLFVFDKPGVYPFWMKEMKFPLDIIWISGDEVVDIWEHAPIPDPVTGYIETYTPQAQAQYVLEVNAGFVQEHEVGVDDLVTIDLE